jgi:hypothetical protein
MAASLDGFIARKAGSVDWLETSDEFADGATADPGFVEAFLKAIDCYVMGSRTYETALRFEAQGLRWSYGDKPIFILQSDRISAAPAIGTGAGLIVAEIIPGITIFTVVLAHRAPTEPSQGIDDAQRMVPFNGGEEAPAVRRHCRAVRMFARPDLADDLEATQVDDMNVVAGAVRHIKFLHRFLLVGSGYGR